MFGRPTKADLARPRFAQRPGAPRRRGAITVLVLVCLVIIAAMSAQLLRITLAERARQQREERTLQAEWLVESGLERAANRLSSDLGYSGETWEISSTDLGGRHSGHVTIQVQTPASQPKQRRVEVRAAYPHDEAEPSRLSKVVTWESAQLELRETR